MVLCEWKLYGCQVVRAVRMRFEIGYSVEVLIEVCESFGTLLW